MNLKKILRFILFLVATFVGLLILIVVVSVVPDQRKVDFTILRDSMTHRIGALEKQSPPPEKGFSIGFAKENLTPEHPVAIAGSGKSRGALYASVHDSIYVRCMVIDNGLRRVAIVSADLLMIPPTVTALLEKELPEIGFTIENTYLGATHTHHSIGSWGKGVASFLYGAYDESLVHLITNKIKQCIKAASANVLPATLAAGSFPVPEAVYNRVTDGGPVDPLVRVVEVKRSDSSRLLLLSYTAHATCLSSRNFQLSGDYPGRLLTILEKQGFAFSMFLAGAVGSHGANAPEGDWGCVDWMAQEIAGKFFENKGLLKEVRDSTIEMHRVSLEMNKPQPKILPNWRIRPCVFQAAFGESPTFISALRIGDVVFLSTPCDFSGEFNPPLDSLGAANHLFPIVTSFNGGYIGYVTPSKYYDVRHHETQLMNWVGQGNGEYMEQCLEDLLKSVAN